ncbi:MAG: hypothetical protein KGL39_56885 [Patescibacteria group bacterium]|nr:hypothetical protein [Patescibacteria group bacterium]
MKELAALAVFVWLQASFLILWLNLNRLHADVKKLDNRLNRIERHLSNVAMVSVQSAASGKGSGYVIQPRFADQPPSGTEGVTR